MLEELLDLMKKAGEEREKTARIALNWPQAVIRLTYADGRAESSVSVDEANEVICTGKEISRKIRPTKAGLNR